jgi:hypothetical protein
VRTTSEGLPAKIPPIFQRYSCNSSDEMSSATELSVEKRRLPNNTFQISVPARNVRTAAGKGAGLHGTVDALMTPSRVVY